MTPEELNAIRGRAYSLASVKQTTLPDVDFEALCEAIEHLNADRTALIEGKVIRVESRDFGTEWYITENGPRYQSGQAMPFDTADEALAAYRASSRSSQPTQQEHKR